MKKSFRRGVELFQELGRTAVRVRFRTFLFFVFFWIKLETFIAIVILHGILYTALFTNIEFLVYCLLYINHTDS